MRPPVSAGMFACSHACTRPRAVGLALGETLALLALASAVGVFAWGVRGAAPAAPGVTAVQETAVTRDLVSALEEEWPPAWTTVELVPTGRTAVLEDLLRHAGYALTPAGNGGVAVEAAIDAVGDLGLYRGSLSAGSGWRVDRLYKREGARLVPRSGYTIRGVRGQLARLPSDRGTYAVEAAPEPAAVEAADCARIGSQRGSLRRNAARLVEECGYRLGRWPGTDVHLRDWVVEEGYRADVEGLRGVLDLMRGYGLVGRVRERDRGVDFEQGRGR